jgi:hypothetical protein
VLAAREVCGALRGVGDYPVSRVSSSSHVLSVRDRSGERSRPTDVRCTLYTNCSYESTFSRTFESARYRFPGKITEHPSALGGRTLTRGSRRGGGGRGGDDRTRRRRTPQRAR